MTILFHLWCGSIWEFASLAADETNTPLAPCSHICKAFYSLITTFNHTLFTCASYLSVSVLNLENNSHLHVLDGPLSDAARRRMANGCCFWLFLALLFAWWDEPLSLALLRLKDVYGSIVFGCWFGLFVCWHVTMAGSLSELVLALNKHQHFLRVLMESINFYQYCRVETNASHHMCCKERNTAVRVLQNWLLPFDCDEQLSSNVEGELFRLKRHTSDYPLQMLRTEGKLGPRVSLHIVYMYYTKRFKA